MKRSIEIDANNNNNKKKRKIEEEEEEEEEEIGLRHLDENLLFEVLKHLDARSLAVAACVSRLWHRTAQDERLWELVCTRNWANIGCANHQLRSVVLTLGGFRRLHSHCLWPLLRPSSSSSAPPPQLQSSLMPFRAPTHWGKDEMNLSISLLSIRYYEKMNLSKRGS